MMCACGRERRKEEKRRRSTQRMYQLCCCVSSWKGRTPPCSTAASPRPRSSRALPLHVDAAIALFLSTAFSVDTVEGRRSEGSAAAAATVFVVGGVATGLFGGAGGESGGGDGALARVKTSSIISPSAMIASSATSVFSASMRRDAACKRAFVSSSLAIVDMVCCR